MFWEIIGVQIGSWMPRINASITNVTIPRYYFGH
jgi:hypothetical protein